MRPRRSPFRTGPWDRNATGLPRRGTRHESTGRAGPPTLLDHSAAFAHFGDTGQVLLWTHAPVRSTDDADLFGTLYAWTPATITGVRLSNGYATHVMSTTDQAVALFLESTSPDSGAAGTLKS